MTELLARQRLDVNNTTLNSKMKKLSISRRPPAQ